MNKQQPFRLGTGGHWGLGVGAGTGHLDLEIFYNEQTFFFWTMLRS